jgi:ADP-ribosylglycohydrolase
MQKYLGMIMNKEEIFSKIYGCLIGHAVGDALGAPTEGMTISEIERKYGLVTDFRKEGFMKDEIDRKQIPTDDTEFTLFTAYILIQHWPKITSEIIAKEWLKYLDPDWLDCITYGGCVSPQIAVRNLRDGLMPPMSGEDNEMGDWSAALMRISPYGLIYPGNPSKASELAYIDACVSHHGSAIHAAQALAASISTAMVSSDVNEIIENGLKVIPECWIKRKTAKALKIAERYSDPLDARKDLVDYLKPASAKAGSYFAGMSAEVLAISYALFMLSKGEFKKGVIAGVNIGRDADTIAATVGSLCGTMNGIKVIPTDWIERVNIVKFRLIPMLGEIDQKKVAEQLANIAFSNYKVK